MKSFMVLALAFLVQYAASQALAPAAPPPPPKPVPTSTACFSAMYNPCGLGSCVNVGITGYNCVCPYGTKIGQRIDGSDTCVPDGSGSTSYTTTEGDSCYLIAITFSISIATLQSQNPSLNCTNIVAGLVLNVDSPLETSSSTCWIRYTVVYSDTCSSIAKRFQVSISQLQAINPALDCNNLLGYSEVASICIRTWRERSKFYVCRQYVTSTVASNRGCRLVAKSSRRTQLFNPGLYCGRLFRFPRLYCRKAIGYNFFPVRGRTCTKGTEYFLKSSDSCNTLYTYFPGSTLAVKVQTFKSYNSNFDCKDRFLFIGQQICIP